jgi:linearmycin/streptolysin S transport system permease protein
MLGNAWTLAHKDLRLFFRDRTALALALVLPLMLATIFGSAMGAMGGDGGGGGVQKVDLQVEDLDDSQASRDLVALLEGAAGLRITVAPEARRAVSGGDMPAALVIPSGYGESLGAGRIPELRLLRDPSRTIAQQVIAGNLLPVLFESVLEGAGDGLMSKVLDGLDFPTAGRAEAQATLDESWARMDDIVGRLKAQGAFDEDSEAEADDAGLNFLEEVPAMLGIVTEDVAGQADDDDFPVAAGASHAIAAMAVMMLMFSLVAAGGTLLEEQAEGTLLRLQLAPSAGPAILIGKLISMGLIGLLQLVVLFSYGLMLFDVPVLDAPFEIGVTSLGVVFAATGLGLLFATLCTSRKQLEGLSTLVILVMSAVGGAWFPREMTPEWFRFAGQFTITAYAMDAFHGILWYGKGLLPTAELGGVWSDVAVLYAIGLGLVLLSFRLYHRRFVLGA